MRDVPPSYIRQKGTAYERGVLAARELCEAKKEDSSFTYAAALLNFTPAFTNKPQAAAWYRQGFIDTIDSFFNGSIK